MALKSTISRGFLKAALLLYFSYGFPIVLCRTDGSKMFHYMEYIHQLFWHMEHH